MKIGLIGCGRWGKHILRDLKTLHASVTVVARSAQSVAIAKAYHADAIVADIAQLPADLDGYVVASTVSTHMEVVRALLPFEKPIFVEKPFAARSSEVEEILRTGRDDVFVMHKWRYHPGIEKIREYVISGELGRVLSIKAARNQWGTPHTDVNTVWVHFPHDLSMIWHVLERIPPMAHSTLIRDKHQQVIGALAVFQDDVLCYIEHHCGHGGKERVFNVHFENGALELADPLSDHLILRLGQPHEQKEMQKVPISTEFPLLLELKCFLEFIEGSRDKVLSPLSVELDIVRKIEEVLANEIPT